MNCAIYCRVSTDHQEVDHQLKALRDYCAAKGWQPVEYVDRGISGSRESRPALDRLLTDMRAGKVNVLLVWAWDRLARSVKQLVGIAEECKRLNVQLISHSQAIDTSSPYGELVFHILAAVAQLERAMIRERVKSGLKAAKARGVSLGAKRVYTLAHYRPKVLELRQQGQSWKKIAVSLQIPRSTAQRIGR